MVTGLNGWITKENKMAIHKALKRKQCGQYLKDVLKGKYLEVLR